MIPGDKTYLLNTTEIPTKVLTMFCGSNTNNAVFLKSIKENKVINTKRHCMKTMSTCHVHKALSIVYNYLQARVRRVHD